MMDIYQYVNIFYRCTSLYRLSIELHRSAGNKSCVPVKRNLFLEFPDNVV